MSDPRYPIGPLPALGPLTAAARSAAFQQIAALPSALHDAVRGLSCEQLDIPYRKGGWSLRQVVHHLADSHVNAYVRHKLVATSVDPVLQGYDENAWAEMPDANGPIGGSLLLLQSLHERWVAFLRALPPAAFARSGRHSDAGTRSLDDLVAIYAWHGRHHVAHITTLRRGIGI